MITIGMFKRGLYSYGIVHEPRGLATPSKSMTTKKILGENQNSRNFSSLRAWDTVFEEFWFFLGSPSKYYSNVLKP